MFLLEFLSLTKLCGSPIKVCISSDDDEERVIFDEIACCRSTYELEDEGIIIEVEAMRRY